MARSRTDTAIGSVGLVEAYARCREIHRTHGRSYYLATRLLAPAKRRHVHALYGFTRWADEIVDRPGPEGPADRQRRLSEWGAALRAGLAGAGVGGPVLPAVVQTIRACGLDAADFERFLAAMAMDLTVAEYASYADLLQYMEGSAAAIGTMMLPVLGLVPGADPGGARECARQLGFAFQLTNFVRDVHEDLARGRVYLPVEDQARYGVTPSMLAADAAARLTSPAVRALIAYECDRARCHYRAALPGIDLLEPRSRVCIRAAVLLYGAILDQIARNGHDVMRARAMVPRRRRLALLTASFSAAWFRRLVHAWGFA